MTTSSGPLVGTVRRTRWRRTALILLAGVLALAAGFWVWWSRHSRLDPSTPNLADADAEVVAVITRARQQVLAERGSADAWGRLGMVLLAHDFRQEANVCFVEAERLDPGELRWPYLRGLTLVMSSPEAGIPCLERAVALSGNRPEPRLRLAEALLEQGRLEEAEHHLQAALELAPGHPRAGLGLARLAFAREKWAEGLHHLESCRADVHARKMAHTLAAEARHRLGQRDRAAQELASARKLPEDQRWRDPFIEEVERLQVGLRVRLARASTLARQNLDGEAIALLEAVVRDYPEHGEAWVELGQLLLKVGQPAHAERVLVQAVRVAPGMVEAWFRLGVARFFLDDRRRAGEAFREVVRLKPDHTLGHYNLGICLKELGDLAGAEHHLRRALSCQPDDQRARKALDEVLASKTPR
jgi:cytochrome c-type biogenesis protein CcmH/NrfG